MLATLWYDGYLPNICLFLTLRTTGSLNPESAKIFLFPTLTSQVTPLSLLKWQRPFSSPGIQNSSLLPSGESSVGMSNSFTQKEWHFLSTGIICESTISRYTGEKERDASTALPGHCSGRELHGGRHTPATLTWAAGSSSPAHLTTEISSRTLFSVKLFSHTQTHCWGATL